MIDLAKAASELQIGDAVRTRDGVIYIVDAGVEREPTRDENLAMQAQSISVLVADASSLIEARKVAASTASVTITVPSVGDVEFLNSDTLRLSLTTEKAIGGTVTWEAADGTTYSLNPSTVTTLLTAMQETWRSAYVAARAEIAAIPATAEDIVTYIETLEGGL